MADPTGSLKGLQPLIAALGPRSRPETAWVARVAGCPIEEAEVAEASLLEHASTVLALSKKIGSTGRTYYAQFPAPIELYALVRLVRPRTLVESGVASGVSSTFLLLGARANSLGTLHSIDYPVTRNGKRDNESWAIPPGMESGWAVPESVRRRWDLRLGKSEALLERLLAEVGTLGFYCHDSPVDVRHFEFEMNTISKSLKPGSLVVCDNTDRGVFDRAAGAAGARALYRRGSSLGAFRVPQ